MRLIDADALKPHEQLEPMGNGRYEYVEVVYKDDIDDAPTIEAEPKTGHWILLDECANSGYYCSECHKKVVREGWSKTVKKINYCPNCGADMKGADDES